MPRRLLLGLVLLPLCLTGCGGDPPADAEPPASPPESTPGSAFDPQTCGEVTGLVTWTGPRPDVPPCQYAVPRVGAAGVEHRTIAAPNAPHIDRNTHALAGALVFLRGIDQKLAKPWDLPPVSVELRGMQIVVVQGGWVGRTGIVRRGAQVTMRSTDPVIHRLRARGAAFFTLPFPDPDKSLTRTFDTLGRVELSSAADYAWQSADLFVCDHPYHALSDSDGRYRFTHVPAGRYELVVWHPNWVVTRTERNIETGLPARLVYGPPLEVARPVTVAPGRLTLANPTLPK